MVRPATVSIAQHTSVKYTQSIFINLPTVRQPTPVPMQVHRRVREVGSSSLGFYRAWALGSVDQVCLGGSVM